MLVYCRTNLALSSEQWPTSLPERPMVGDLIESATCWGQFRLRLKVVRVTWAYGSVACAGCAPRWHCRVELHDWLDRSIQEFYEWYAPLVGRSVSNFI